jgi:hypothetical protein
MCSPDCGCRGRSRRRWVRTQTTAWKIKHKLKQVMLERDATKRLTGRIEIDDAYLGGERSGGKPRQDRVRTKGSSDACLQMGQHSPRQHHSIRLWPPPCLQRHNPPRRLSPRGPTKDLAVESKLAFPLPLRRGQVPMVKRQKVEDAAGVLEFKGRTADDPEFASWLAEHRAHKGGKIRISQGGTGVRVMFTRESDMVLWKRRSEKAAKATS